MNLDRIVILVPGFLGSALTAPSGVEVWGENLTSNYRRIIDNPAILSWSDLPASAAFLDCMKVKLFHIAIKRVGLWGRTLDCLHSHPHFGPQRMFTYPYDWRQSILKSAETLAAATTEYRRYFTTLSHRRPKVVFVTHSMGGLLVRAAVGRKLLSPKVIDRIIHIGSPLHGAPSAFSSTFGTINMPLMPEIMQLMHGRRFDVFRGNFLTAVGTFESAWELYPWTKRRFVRLDGDSRFIHPFSAGRLVDDHHEKRASAVHKAVQDSIQILRENGVAVSRIYTESLAPAKTEIEFEVRRDIFNGRRQYSLSSTRVTTNGDGTVPSDSASESDADHSFPVVDVPHAFMCDHPRVAQMLSVLL